MGINAKCIKREVNKKCVEIAKTNHKTKTNKITEAMEWFSSIECTIFMIYFCSVVFLYPRAQFRIKLKYQAAQRHQIIIINIKITPNTTFSTPQKPNAIIFSFGFYFYANIFSLVVVGVDCGVWVLRTTMFECILFFSRLVALSGKITITLCRWKMCQIWDGLRIHSTTSTSISRKRNCSVGFAKRQCHGTCVQHNKNY